MNDFERLSQQVARLQLELNDVGGQLIANQPPSLGSPFPSFTPPVIGTSPSAVNQIRNGEAGHSVDTWFDAVASPNADEGKECAHWFSNDTPVAGQLLSFVNALTNPANKTLKAYGNFGGVHSTYDPAYCDWDRVLGQMRLQGTKSLDAPFPNNRVAVPNRAAIYVGALIALRNDQIRVPADCHIYAGIWDNTVSAPRPDWVKGTAFAVTGSVRGTPATTTERRYKVFAFTDRGYTYLSTELTLLTAPSDAAFATTDVFLTWKPIPGILEYHVYRFDVTAAKFRKLVEIASGANNYVDNGAILPGQDDVGAYPVATSTTPMAYVATRENELASLPIDVLEAWVPLFLNVPVPSDYDVGVTTAEQVLRIGMTKALDREVSDAVVNNGSTNLDSASAVFTALDTGRNVVVTKGADVHATTITFVDADSVTMAAPWPFANAVDATLYITGGGDHGILIDAVHASYVSGAAFAPYPDDLNRLANGGQNPIAAPNHSQGGPGGGGLPGTGRGGLCVAVDCPVNVLIGNSLESLAWKAITAADVLFSGDLRPNQVLRKPKGSTDSLQLVRVRASWLYDIELPCSPGHPLITSRFDSTGRPVDSQQPGNPVLISIDGQVSRKAIREIVDTGQASEVGTFALSPGHVYVAGRVFYRTPIHRFLARILGLFRREPVVGILSHNLKGDPL